jgi:cell division protein FtsI (penicillin-binding protein 3)/stage V sporulation protein D (sporulation-specific penicillin-binding protein)
MLTRKSNRRKSEKANRLHLIMAIVFLLVGSVLFKLCSIQVLKYDLYVALASGQHQIYNELKPDRGRIFIQDSQDFSDSELYPVAANKEFALVYAIPKEIQNPLEVAEKLYLIFDQDKVAEEVEELLENDEYFLDSEGSNIIFDINEQKREEFKAVKRELEIKLRKEKIIENYEKILSKKNDPYEPIRYKVDEAQLAEVNKLAITGISYIMETHRYYPEGNVGAHILGFVGFNDEKKCGQYGLEGFFNEELSGRFGSIKAERSATGDLIIINDREYNKPQNGSDLILTINRSIQFFASRKLNEIAMRHGADGGSIIVMDPYTGAILAMCSWPDYDPNNYEEVDDINIYNNPAIFSQFEPGSVFKAITMAAGIDQGKITPETTYYDKGMVKVEGWPKPLKNSDFDTHGGHGTVNMVTVLEESLNTGAVFVMQKTGAEIFADYVKNFGFGEKIGIELETESVGNIKSLTRKKIRPVEAATASYGQGITATPLQIITAYAAIANGGILMKPYLVGQIISPTGERIKTQPKQIRRVISERTALLLSGMLVNVVEGGHAKRAGVDGYFIGGKTGTAEVADKEKRGYSDRTIHTFVGFAPVDEPKFVMLVKLDDPKSVRFAASSAAPLFGEIAEFILNYYQVPKGR